MPTTPAAHFADRLANAIDARNTPACVGLDPVIDKLPAILKARHHEAIEAIQEFCLGVIDVVAPIVPVIKPQSACFERYGSAGVRVLRRVMQAAHERGMIVLLDAKRGDIGVTAEHYAHAAFGASQEAAFGADAVTLSGYMGPDTIEPFFTSQANQPATRGVFVLVRTSNPGSDAVQAQRLADGRSVAEMIGDMVHELGRTRVGACGLSDVGAVVGATKSADAKSLRLRMPDTVFLIPGYGAQGGTLDDIRPALRNRSSGKPSSASSLGVLVNASRSVLYPAVRPSTGTHAHEEWTACIRDAAMTFAADLRSLMAS